MLVSGKVSFSAYRHLINLGFFVFTCLPAFSQDAKPFIRLTQPQAEKNMARSAVQFIVGSTCKDCTLMISQVRVKVYPTGSFAHDVRLNPGDTSFTLVVINAKGKTNSKRVHYSFKPVLADTTVSTFSIATLETYPEGDLFLQPGDEIRFRVKALPGQRLTTVNNTVLHELPPSQTRGISGIYQGTYTVLPTDSFRNARLSVMMTGSSGERLEIGTRSLFTVMNISDPDIVVTRGRLAHLEYGLGDDRLGGAKIGYIDSLIPLRIVGKVGSHYKVRLAQSRTAYIPDEHVYPAAKGTFHGSGLTGKWRVIGDSTFDQVSIELTDRLPYQSFQLLEPSRIVVDIFGATNNTNWITQLQNCKEIKDVSYEQVADDIFRIYISLKHKQHWGHSIAYRGNTLIIKVRHQPTELTLSKLVVAVDAGHGGTNTGAMGPTGILEKELTLALSLKLQQRLRSLGAKTIMTREKEEFFDNKERILFYRDSLPDLLLSIHLNSSSDPINVEGTAMFYRYPGFRCLNEAIYKRMLGLGLKEYGCNSSFNFMLNSPTEYPNALVEALFLSNPAEEMKILDDKFQDQMVESIVQGVRDFLQGCK